MTITKLVFEKDGEYVNGWTYSQGSFSVIHTHDILLASPSNTYTRECYEAFFRKRGYTLMQVTITHQIDEIFT